MSYAAQEQALLDLLFDRERRAAFRADRRAALAPYDLSVAEVADFDTVRLEALEMDATARVNFILAQYCRSYPLAFSLVSSLPQGLDLLRGCVDAALIRTLPNERLAAFGLRLRERLGSAAGFTDAREQALFGSIVEAELGMACTAQLAREAALAGGGAGTRAASGAGAAAGAGAKAEAVEGAGPRPGEGGAAPALPANWLQRPLRLAPLTSAAILPRPYAALKGELCPCTGAELWRQLGRQPLSPSARTAALARPDLRLLVARALVARASPCEPVVEHVTVELGEGFARLLPHIDGQASVASLLDRLREAGAAEPLLAGVLAAFRELGRQGMLQVGD